MFEQKEYGPSGPKGEPGPFCERSEKLQVNRIIREIEQTIQRECRTPCRDGENPHISVDFYLLLSAQSALKHYRDLMDKPLKEWIGDRPLDFG